MGLSLRCHKAPGCTGSDRLMGSFLWRRKESNLQQKNDKANMVCERWGFWIVAEERLGGERKEMGRSGSVSPQLNCSSSQIRDHWMQLGACYCMSGSLCGHPLARQLMLGCWGWADKEQTRSGFLRATQPQLHFKEADLWLHIFGLRDLKPHPVQAKEEEMDRNKNINLHKDYCFCSASTWWS